MNKLGSLRSPALPLVTRAGPVSRALSPMHSTLAKLELQRGQGEPLRAGLWPTVEPLRVSIAKATNDPSRASVLTALTEIRPGCTCRASRSALWHVK